MSDLIIFPQQEQLVSTLRNLFRVFVNSTNQSESGVPTIRPHFHITGSSGSGKTYLVNAISEEFDLPVIEINAASITAEGLSGNSLSKALRPLRNHWNVPNVILIDEFDKLFLRNGEDTEGFRSAVQDEFLTALESAKTSVFTDYGKYEPVAIDRSLFIFAGAYSNMRIRTAKDLHDAGLRTEFVGRVPLVFHTEEVPLGELKKYIRQASLFKEYGKMFPKLVNSKAVNEIFHLMEVQAKETQIGIRAMNSCIHQYFIGAITDE